MDTEKIDYFLSAMAPTIDEWIEQVLSDSEATPVYSAVAACNVIKCYIQIRTDLGKAPPFDSVERYFEMSGYTEDDYHRFEARRKKEAEYYIGIQY